MINIFREGRGRSRWDLVTHLVFERMQTAYSFRLLSARPCPPVLPAVH